ncbi:MAG: cytochrome b/b6 domain-containing protein [Geminicoccaceae bacterium]
MDGSGIPAGAEAATATVSVWDPLVRVFHWSLVTAYATAWIADAEHAVHRGAGYVVLALVGFRLVWGLIGPRHARFKAFVPGPRRLLAYLRSLLRGRAARHLGHNPAGGAMIVALLALLVALGVTGWLQTTDTFWGSEWLEETHEALAYASLLLVGLHLSGVLASSLMHRENLVRAMLTGRKPLRT